MADKTPNPDLADYLHSLNRDHAATPEAAVLALVESFPVAGQVAPIQGPPASPTQETSPAASASPTMTEPAPSTPTVPSSSVARPLAYFTTPAKEVTKKQSVYLPVELHRALATVVNLPGVEVSLTDLLANIVQAWRDDHRAEVRKRYRDGEKSI